MIGNEEVEGYDLRQWYVGGGNVGIRVILFFMIL